MIHITRWKPDTCECVIEYSWDDAQNEDIRTHTVSKIVSKCQSHVTEPDDTAHFSKVTGENQLKNKSLGEIIKGFSKLTNEVFDLQGNSMGRVLKNGAVSWSFDASRVLHLSIPSLTTLEKTTVKSTIDTLLGSGKVVIE